MAHAQRFAAGFALAAGLAFAARAELPAGEVPPEAAPPASIGASPAPEVPAVPRMAPEIERLARAWSSHAPSLTERAARTRAVADELGLASLDPLARAILWDAASDAPELERARAAALLAPSLPLALAALARAEGRDGAPTDAARSALASVRALATHFDGWIWLGATLAMLAALALAAAAIGFLGARALAASRLVAHDLGDAVEASMPGVARIAALVAIVLVPVALGEGLAGLALACFALAFVERSHAHRIALALASLCLFAAVHPLARIAGSHFAMLRGDPVGAASWAAEAGFLDPVDARRLARAAGPPTGGATPVSGDPLAVAALAEWTRRAGDLAAADAHYGALVAAGGADAGVLSNAAGLKLARNDPDAAVELYRRALAIEPSALLWFNLSQAHGAAIDVEQHDRALEAAQSIDPVAVSELAKRLAAAPMAQVPGAPLAQARVRERLRADPAHADTLPFRQVLAPGWLGRSPLALGLGFALAAAAALAFGRAVAPSTRCRGCAVPLCPRCNPAPHGDGRCDACHPSRLALRGTPDRAPAGRAGSGRLLGAVQSLLPGLSRASSRGAAFGLPVAVAAAAALAFGLGHGSVLPDPGSIGEAGPFLGWLAAAACAAAYLALATLAGFAARRLRP